MTFFKSMTNEKIINVTKLFFAIQINYLQKFSNTNQVFPKKQFLISQKQIDAIIIFFICFLAFP